MSVIADRLAALQYVQAWTAHVDLEICKPVDGAHISTSSNLVLKRRRESVFVRDPVNVTFFANEVLGQEPVLPPPAKGKRLTPQPIGPRSGWALTCSAPVWVTQIVLINAETKEIAWTPGNQSLCGVTRGSLVVPLGYCVRFTLERQEHWETNVAKIIEVSKNV